MLHAVSNIWKKNQCFWRYEWNLFHSWDWFFIFSWMVAEWRLNGDGKGWFQSHFSHHSVTIQLTEWQAHFVIYECYIRHYPVGNEEIVHIRSVIYEKKKKGEYNWKATEWWLNINGTEWSLKCTCHSVDCHLVTPYKLFNENFLRICSSTHYYLVSRNSCKAVSKERCCFSSILNYGRIFKFKSGNNSKKSNLI